MGYSHPILLSHPLFVFLNLMFCGLYAYYLSVQISSVIRWLAMMHGAVCSIQIGYFVRVREDKVRVLVRNVSF